MGIALLSVGSLGAWNNKVLPPVTRGLEAWFDFSTDAARFSFNRAIGKANGAIIGSPTAFEGYGRFKGNTNYVRTDVNETSEQTLIAVCRAVASPTGTADAQMYVSNYNGAPIDGVHTGNNAHGAVLTATSATSIVGYACRDDGTGSAYGPYGAALTGETATSWAIRSMRISNGEPTRVDNSTRNANAQNAQVTPRVLNGQKFCIGSRSSTGTDYAGESDIAMAMVFSVRLTNTELAQIVEFIRTRMNYYGISV